MAKSPMRFKRIMAKFDDDARARLCQSSGSEHSSNNSITDLSDLVDSFFEPGCCDRGGEKMENDFVDEIRDDQEVSGYNCTDLEDKEMLVDLFEGGSDIDDDDDDVCTKRAICFEVESLCSNLDDCSSEGFKRSLMSLLRQRGYDAGLCKSRWAKTGHHPAGEYEYIDILISNTRYIIEVSLESEFTIARPTKTYQTLLETIPKITVIKPKNLKKVVRLMCAAMRTSLKTKDMAISPWRKNGYMQSKWFGSYKRTTNANATSPATSVSIDGQSLLGFEFSPAVKSYCRKQVERMHVVGNLKTLMLGGMS
ncbi:hypothetical protein CTI12_AA493830 [Artemisia annua]|uniref:Uncharacterized protein n=1 Tax=Artemisia annua TaxID=35608 RepID=A0A2U1LGK0_ARTAN|nr:hypothetical protein CTI12_AA493830 [Artemisia annua]